MVRTGPQKYPKASTRYWYQDNYPGNAMETNVIVWHTTEGRSLPSYSGGSSAPNFTAMPDFTGRRLIWYQHFDFDTSSRALRNTSGGVETNTLNVCQVEIVGTCDPAAHKKWGSASHLYTPQLPDWAIRDLAAFSKWANEQHRVPLTSGVTFKPYPSSYGSNGVRMSHSAWNGFKGHCGHMHVPENSHGDPGTLPMGKILQTAKTGGVDMALSTNDVEKLATTDGVFKSPDYKLASVTNKHWTLESYQYETYRMARAARDTAKANGAQLAAQAAAISELAKALAAHHSEFDPDSLVTRIEERIAAIRVSLDIQES